MRRSDRLTEILDYAEGTLDADATARITTRLETDRVARELLDDYRLVRNACAGPPLTAPSPAAIEQARALFARRHRAPAESPAPSSWLERIEHAIAAVIFDSRLSPAGVRHAAGGRRYHMTHATEDVTVDLVVERTDERPRATRADRWRVMGQLTPGDVLPEGGRVAAALAGSTVPVAETQTDERAMFTFDLPCGRYDLVVDGALQRRPTVLTLEIG